MRNVKFADNLNHNIRIFYLAIILKAVAISMPHAILTLVFLNKGISYAQIAIIQAVYSIGIILFEFPSGVMADKYSKKTIFLISNLIMLCSYIIVLFFNSFYMLILAWLIYGISNAFETGTIDSQIIIAIKRTYKPNEIQKRIEKFIGTGSSLSALASIIGAGVGFFIYQIIEVNIYYLMLALIIICELLILFQYRYIEINHERKSSSINKVIKDTTNELKNSVALRWLILGFGVLQMYIQIHFQMWQSYFLESGYNEQYFLALYLLFQAISIIIYRLPVSKLFSRYLYSFEFLGIISAILLFYSVNKGAIILLYCIPVIIILMIKYFLEINYNMKVKEENISSLTSLTSTIMRCFGAVTLLIASFIIKVFSLKMLYFLFQIITIIVASRIGNKFLLPIDENGYKKK